MRFEYQSTHFPTGLVTKLFVECDSEVDFFRHLNAWNLMGKGVYLYTIKGHAPKGHAAHDFNSSRTVTAARRDPNKVHQDGGWWTNLQKATGAIPTVSRKT